MIQLVNATSNRIPLADESVHCVVTSPPYWGLRDYGLPPRVWDGETGCGHVWGENVTKKANGGPPESMRLGGGQATTQVGTRFEAHSQFCQRCGAWCGCLGLEPTPEMYVEHVVEVFREVWRVLRNDGTVWLNLGDSYNSAPGGYYPCESFDRPSRGAQRRGRQPLRTTTLKPKDLCGIPWRVAFALQADGWWLRRDIIWAKTNPMPESVRDRPTSSHEYLFLLSKNARYFYDADAVRESGVGRETYFGSDAYSAGSGRNDSGSYNPTTCHTRNRRSVWTIATKPYAGAHFATYPPALVEPCIKAGTSERGVCPECGAPWERVVEKELVPTKKAAKTFVIDDRDFIADGNDQGSNRQKDGHKSGYINRVTTTGWRPTCDCCRVCNHYNQLHGRRKCPVSYDPIPATVLDPFVGSGTTLMVARKLGRSGIGLDLSWDYLSRQARKRLELDKLAAWREARPAESVLADLPLFQGM